MTRRQRPGVRRGVLFAYALPAFVLALPTIPVYVFLPAFYGDQLELGLATTGLILLVARIFDTVTDPVIGVLCDRYAWRGMRRKPWIAAGAVIAGIGMFRILNPGADVSGTYLLGWSVVLYLGWTMISVPYLAWGAELSPDYNERTRITSWREGMTLLGIVGAGAVTAAATSGLGWPEDRAMGALAWVAIGLGAFFIPVLLWRVPDASRGGGPRSPATWRTAVASAASLLENRPFARLISAWFLNGIANGIPAVLFFIYLEHGLGVSGDRRPLFVLAYFAAAVVSVPLWWALSRRLGKHRTWCWAMIYACAAFVIVPWIPYGDFLPFAVVCFVTGMAFGADLVLPPAIQADVVDYDELKSRKARAGVQFAIWGMSTKLALALAVGVGLPGLQAAGFDPTAPSEDGRRALLVIYALVPVVIKLTAVSMIWRFPLTAEKQAIIRRKLSHRKAGVAEGRDRVDAGTAGCPVDGIVRPERM